MLRAFVKVSFLRDVQAFSLQPPHTIECFSDEFFEHWTALRSSTDVFGRTVRLGGPIGFCYIDGNHTYDFAKRDFENTDRFLVSRGFVLFDDSGDGSGWEVNNLAHEVADCGRYETISHSPNYLFRKH